MEEGRALPTVALDSIEGLDDFGMIFHLSLGVYIDTVFVVIPFVFGLIFAAAHRVNVIVR